ncbi:MAG: hypothetical protein U9P14_11360, partial [Gemmatimonadota bacterium]|nr:hypothetical protein [Gemmatimonadota bacterium]
MKRNTNQINRTGGLWACLFLAGMVFCSCSEVVDNSLGLGALPGGAVGGLPVRAELHRMIEVMTVPGQVAGKGTQMTVYLGRTKQYQMRTLLNFLIDLPEQAVLTRARLQV